MGKPTVLKLNDDEKEALKGLSDKEKVKFLNKLCAEAQKKAEEVYVAPVEDDSDEEGGVLVCGRYSSLGARLSIRCSSSALERPCGREPKWSVSAVELRGAPGRVRPGTVQAQVCNQQTTDQRFTCFVFVRRDSESGCVPPGSGVGVATGPG